MARGSVVVVGGGAWGMALAAAAARQGGPTYVVSRRVRPGDGLPAGVQAAKDMGEAVRAAKIVVLAVPSTVVRDVLRDLGDHLDGRHYVVHGIRGLPGDPMRTVAEVVREETAARRLGALGGPALAEDLIEGRPSVLVCGSDFPEVNVAVRAAFGSPTLRVYATDDLLGLEWASALVGCLAIGVGYAQATGMSAGLVAAFISRAMSEAARIAAAAGGDERTLFGLAGYGDLLASIAQAERPEVRLGAALARGQSLDQAVADVRQRVEAVALIPRVARFAEGHKVHAPIFKVLAHGVLASHDPATIIHELMTSPLE